MPNFFHANTRHIQEKSILKSEAKAAQKRNRFRFWVAFEAVYEALKNLQMTRKRFWNHLKTKSTRSLHRNVVDNGMIWDG